MIKTDFTRWTFRNFLDFSKRLASDEGMAQLIVMKVITEWDYDIPFAEDALDELWPLDAAEVMHEVAIALNDEIGALDTSIVRVDFKTANWRNKRFKEFLAARADMNAPKIESMLREVCHMDGFTPEDVRPLTFHEGARMVRAVMEVYQNKLSGKA